MANRESKLSHHDIEHKSYLYWICASQQVVIQWFNFRSEVEGGVRDRGEAKRSSS